MYLNGCGHCLWSIETKMALVKASLSLGSADLSNDITSNLGTLQFENGLTNEETSLNYLRKQSYALTVTACAQAAFFVSRLRDARCRLIDWFYSESQNVTRPIGKDVQAGSQTYRRPPHT